MPDALEAARIYHDAKKRIAALVSTLDHERSRTAVAACPGWSVRDVVAHLAAVADDWGRRGPSGPPTDRETAAQVARFDGEDLAGILAAWTSAADTLCRLAKTDGVEPPVGDVTCHEHDIRAALGRPGARTSDAVRYTSDRLLANLRTPTPVRVTVEDADYRSGSDGGPELRLRTTRFEAVRWRTGRRSRAQLTAMDWSGDPAPVLDHLYLFGPSHVDIIE